MQYAVVFVALSYAGWLVAASLRLHKQRLLSEAYLKNFMALCEDNSVSIELLENMQQVFSISCRYCAALTIFYLLAKFRMDEKFRKSVDAKTLVDVKTLSPSTKKAIISTYESLFLFASYSIPGFGWVIRLAIDFTGKKAKDSVRPGVFLTVGYRVVYA